MDMRKKMYFLVLVSCIILLTACGTKKAQQDVLTQSMSATEERDSMLRNDIDTANQVKMEEETEFVQKMENVTEVEEKKIMDMKVQVGGYTFSAVLEDNDAAAELVELMKEQPIVIRMSDYSGFEKVGSLGTTLPESNSQITTQAGDIILYNGNQIVVFYGSNSWNYTKIGHVENLTGWEEALGTGDITITFSID